MKYIFLFLPVFSYAQYFSLGLTDNSIPNEFKSVSGIFYEVGYNNIVSDLFSINYGVRINKADFQGDRKYSADYLTFLINPKFRIVDGDPMEYISGFGFRIGGNLDKSSRLAYLQSNVFFQIGIGFKNFELSFAYDVSTRNGIYLGEYPLKTGSLSLTYYLHRPGLN